jgi:proline-rich protein PRCC
MFYEHLVWNDQTLLFINTQPVSNKGKPSKLHRRKHQIGTLYFDMKQKEMELMERRSRGFMSKAETQAKYGW